MTEPILISISQNVSITPVTGITDEVNRCYQPSVDEKYEEGAFSLFRNMFIDLIIKLFIQTVVILLNRDNMLYIYDKC